MKVKQRKEKSEGRRRKGERKYDCALNNVQR